MVKIATGEGLPLRQGAGTGLDWFSVATEASSGGTPDLSSPWMFLGYVGEQNRSGVPLSQASVATKNLSGARSGTLSEGDPITGGHLHHPGAIHDEEGVVHPQG